MRSISFHKNFNYTNDRTEISITLGSNRLRPTNAMLIQCRCSIIGLAYLPNRKMKDFLFLFGYQKQNYLFTATKSELTQRPTIPQTQRAQISHNWTRYHIPQSTARTRKSGEKAPLVLGNPLSHQLIVCRKCYCFSNTLQDSEGN